MKLFTNKLGKLRLFWFFDCSLTHTQKKIAYRHPTKLSQMSFTRVRDAKLSKIA